MKVLWTVIVVFTLSLVFTSCDEEDDYFTPAPSGVAGGGSELDDLTDSQKDVVSYFEEIALGFEYGDVSRVTRKWDTDMNVYVSGDVSDEILAELISIIAEINSMVTDGFEINLVDDQSSSNYHVFIGTAQAYANIYPDVEGLVDENWGLFTLFWDGEDNLNGGHMYVDNYRPSLTAQKHLLREEFTQSLGLARDATTYSNSIFQSAWTTTTSYADIDKELIELLYHANVTSGLSKSEVEPILIEILLENS